MSTEDVCGITSGCTRQGCDEANLLDLVVFGRAASRPVLWAAPGACLT